MRRMFITGLLMLVGASVLASGTLQPSTPALPDAPDRDPFSVTKSLKGRIVLLQAPNRVMIVDPKTGEEKPLQLAQRARLRAANKKLFAGRKKLKFEDLAIGQEVKISYRPHTHEIVKIKVLAPPPRHLD